MNNNLYTDKTRAPVNIERIVAMAVWSLTKNHSFEYLKTLEVRQTADSKELIVKVPKYSGSKWEGTRPVPESKLLLSDGEKANRLSIAYQFLQECCQPGKLGSFDAATVKTISSESGDFISVVPTGDNNPGVKWLRAVAASQMKEALMQRSNLQVT